MLNLKHIRTKQLAAVILAVLITLFAFKSQAQVSNFHSVFFQNQYLTNPAMAGITKGLNLNFGYQQPTNSTPGALKIQALTADYNTGNNVGLGLNLNSDQNGLISHTRIVATYAYHLPLNEDDRLSFGLSLGMNNIYIDPNKIVGDQGDLSVARLNNRTLYVDGDFGIAYTGKALTIQAAVPNLKSVVYKDNSQDLETNSATFFTAIGYKIATDEGSNNNFTLEPKVAYRGVKGSANIFDAGLNFELTDYNFNVSGMYHSNKSQTVAFGFDLKPVGFLLAYTNNPGALKNYNTIEIGLKVSILK